MIIYKQLQTQPLLKHVTIHPFGMFGKWMEPSCTKWSLLFIYYLF